MDLRVSSQVDIGQSLLQQDLWRHDALRLIARAVSKSGKSADG
jgi:hypothetical protein